MDRIVYTKYKFYFDIYIYKKNAYEFFLELLHAALVVLAGADAADSAGDYAFFRGGGLSREGDGCSPELPADAADESDAADPVCLELGAAVRDGDFCAGGDDARVFLCVAGGAVLLFDGAHVSRWTCAQGVVMRALRSLVLAALLVVGAISSASAAELPVTSPFGWRVHPISGDWRFHAGVDLGYPQGVGIAALFPGIVTAAGDFGDGYGNQVLVYHADGDTFTRYAHCSAVFVCDGEAVEAGQVIGTVGSTGNATGPHLHLEYIVPTEDGYAYADPMDLF